MYYIFDVLNLYISICIDKIIKKKYNINKSLVRMYRLRGYMQDLKGKKLLILAGAGVHNKVVRTAREMGIYTIVTDNISDSPAKKIADEAWMYSVTDVKQIVARCKKEHIDGVLNFCIDPAQKPYQEICDKLGRPCYATKEQFKIMTDKRLFKKFCTDHNVDVIPDYSEEDILHDRVSYPVFIKPTDSRGSRGQAVCYTKQEALCAVEQAREYSSDGSYICEQYMIGKQDIGSAFFVVDGEPHLVKFGDRFLGREEDNLQKQVVCTCLPSSFSSVFEKKHMQNVKNMIKSLGIQYGPVFLQGFVDGDTIRYYDPALRMPGGDYDLIVRKVTGFDTVKSQIYFALTGETDKCFGNPADAYKLAGGTALLVTISVRAGLISKVVGFEQVMSMQSVIYGRQIIGEGTIIQNNGDISQRVAAFGLYLPHGESVKKELEHLYHTYKVIDEHGEDMVVSKYSFG